MTTTKPNTLIKTPTPPDPAPFPLPDIPEREPDDMTSAQHLSETGLQHHLKQFLGNSDTTIVSGEKYITAYRGADMRYPDLLVAFGVDPQAYRDTNGYVIAEQGKPPDFVLEIASKATGHIDVGEKREFYQRVGIPEYWRFDATGEFHGAKLAGDRLVNGRYEPIPIDELPDGVLQGHSPGLNLLLRWDSGEFALHDPATEEHIATFESEQARADTAEVQRSTAEARAIAAEAQRGAERSRADSERQARIAAEAQLAAERARVSQLEALLQQQNPDTPA